MHYSGWAFIVDQWRTQPSVVKADLTGKTVIVLGANTGLGFEATKHFATMNPGRLILACRSQSKGEVALDKLKADTGYSKAELWIIDLADFSSVKQFADKFERDGGRLDVLVENAAIASMKYVPSKDNWETSLQVNNLSTPLLALLLLPAMIRTAEQYSTTPRIVVVSSSMHYWVKINKDVSENPDMLKTLGSAEYCTNKNMMDRYALTKLFNVLFVRALNDRLPSSIPVIASAVDPGYCYSELRREFSGVMAVFDWLLERTLAFTAEVGSRRLIWTALSHQDQPEKLRGQYSSNFHMTEVSDFVLSPEGVKAQNRSWDELVDILGQVDPRVTANVQKYLSHDITV
ncbi:WW domain-containing oxidoreductase [Mycena sanguinolenta]|uniref:WW domain-containing oxidoreductase n=1 Tax=Mycena sanguinolenta TaxID=230812 RepID=A0A8H6Z5A5_9AGAR|nr:WW domain-containing oxidoreductase [Mycena sanguinolenta]